MKKRIYAKSKGDMIELEIVRYAIVVPHDSFWSLPNSRARVSMNWLDGNKALFNTPHEIVLKTL